MAAKRTILLGVTGSIAAYKAADTASKLKKLGHDVFCVMTKDAAQFITPLTLQTLSQHPVTIDLFEAGEGDWRPSHLQLADDADLLMISPATANVITKLALGIADDALSTIALALRPEAKVLVAPAMNGKMWLHPATQANVKTLESRGVEFIGPDKGLLACGYEGIGRLWDVDKIVEKIEKVLK
jgi:phosphopantothenoylcysteine decarboxylase